MHSHYQCVTAPVAREYMRLLKQSYKMPDLSGFQWSDIPGQSSKNKWDLKQVWDWINVTIHRAIFHWDGADSPNRPSRCKALVLVNWAAALIDLCHVAMEGQRGTGQSVLDTDSPLILEKPFSALLIAVLPNCGSALGAASKETIIPCFHFISVELGVGFIVWARR